MREFLRRHAPSLVVAAGILASTYVAVHALPAAPLAPPLLLAVAVMGASMLDAALRGARVRPSTAVLIVALMIPAAWVFMDGHEPRVLASMLPAFGLAGWAALSPAAATRARCNHDRGSRA